MSLPDYAELHCLSDFSFGRGASNALELCTRAKRCGYRALAITDECSLAGAVRAFEAARRVQLPLILGSEVQLADGPKLVLLVETLAGYHALCALITHGRRRAAKGQYHLTRADLADGLPGTLALWLPGPEPAPEHGVWLRGLFDTRAWLAVQLLREGDDAARLHRLRALGADLGLPLVAAGDVHMHVRSRRTLQDTLTAIAHGQTVAAACGQLYRNGERHLRWRQALAAIYPPELLATSVRIAARCRFTLDALHYRYPAELVPAGQTPAHWLRHLVEQGMARRWPQGASAAVRAQIEHELALIAELRYEAYFLTVEDIVRFARGRGILCQGRGSAANSAVCFALGITAVDPAHSHMLMERFISRERREPPDIDVDFEHARREEVIQYIYERYGRQRAALTAEVIRYRGKSAIGAVAKALGLPAEAVHKLSFALDRWHGEVALEARVIEAGFDPASPLMARVLALTQTLIGRPRHLSQHVGGFVISDAPLHTLVPVENAAMPGRTIIQWDKDDLDTMGLLKIDCLALGMLTALRKCMDLLRRHGLGDHQLATLPRDDAATWAMLQRADTVGVFQVESRAQMSMLPRLKPACFYDLVIEVAIVRPGPIQGNMVHPYLRRRRGQELVSYPSAAVRGVLERTLGVPLFQEQVMQLAIQTAGYTPGEADQLRRAMAAWKRHGDLEGHRRRIIEGMQANGYTAQFAADMFERLKGFGSYGFPESHAASFALLVWASAWLKCHHPAAFACALLNAQPMGFYGPSQLLADARRHGVTVRPVDVGTSGHDCTLEPAASPAQRPALRLGLRLIRGLSANAAARITAARAQRGFADLADLVQRADLDARERRLLADAGALRTLAGHRHRARWAAAGIEPQRPLFGRSSPAEVPLAIAPPSQAADTLADYAATGLTLGPHPLHLIRTQLQARHCQSARQLRTLGNHRRARTAGLVTLRQRPPSAGGVTFVTVEDETGSTNILIRAPLAQRQRRQLLGARLLAVDGYWQSSEGVGQLIATGLHDYNALLGALDSRARDFR